VRERGGADQVASLVHLDRRNLPLRLQDCLRAYVVEEDTCGDLVWLQEEAVDVTEELGAFVGSLDAFGDLESGVGEYLFDQFGDGVFVARDVASMGVSEDVARASRLTEVFGEGCHLGDQEVANAHRHRDPHIDRTLDHEWPAFRYFDVVAERGEGVFEEGVASVQIGDLCGRGWEEFVEGERRLLAIGDDQDVGDARRMVAEITSWLSEGLECEVGPVVIEDDVGHCLRLAVDHVAVVGSAHLGDGFLEDGVEGMCLECLGEIHRLQRDIPLEVGVLGLPPRRP